MRLEAVRGGVGGRFPCRLRENTMSISVIIHPERVAMRLGYVRIRDRILIDATLRKKLEDLPGSITLVAREIEHAPGIDVILPGRRITVVADHYDAKGGTINVSGVAGTSGVNGLTGSVGLAGANFNRPGGPGARAAAGGNGENGGSIRIIAQRLGDVRLVAMGGAGGKGGDGGRGGRGGDGRSGNQHFDGFDGSTGGDGGAGGNGGTGGRGGNIDVEFTAAGVPPSPLIMQVDAGPSGAAGRAGPGGDSGNFADGPSHGPTGRAGQPGASGTPGSTRIEPIGASAFWAHAAERVGTNTTTSWAAYRLLVGLYFYRQFKPGVTGLENRLRMASTEFDAVLRLQPGNEDAIRYNRQIALGHNVLGLPTNLDLDPRFDEYLSRFTSFATFITSFYNQGISLILAGQAQSVAELQLALDESRIATEIAFATADLAAAETGVEAANRASDDVESRLALMNERIKVASAAKPDEGINIGAIVTTVGTVAVAVGSVIAAVPTAGASLFALVPSLAGLAVQLNDMGGHIFEATTTEKDDLKAKYEKVGKNVDNVVKGVKSVVNLVNAIKQLTDGRTAGNAEVIDLMRQGVQLAHELLIAKLRVEQSELTVTARRFHVQGSQSLAMLARSQRQKLAAGEKIFIEGGRSAIRATQRKIDTTLRVSFQAERSVEIYTFRDESALIAFDTGFIHPDIEADFDEQDISTPALVDAYSRAFLPLLDPLDLQLSFDGYFNSDAQFELVRGLHFESVTNESSLNAFRTSHDGYRSLMLLIDFPDLSAREFEAKVEQVSVALVGGSALLPALTCQIQHGGIYLSRLRNGETITQILTAHIARVSPQFTPFLEHMPLPSTAPQGSGRARTDHLWGRGVGGQWLLSIADSDIVANGVNLDGLTEVQLLIETQLFARRSP